MKFTNPINATFWICDHVLWKVDIVRSNPNILIEVLVNLKIQSLSPSTLTYWMIVERYPKLNEVVGNLIHDSEIFFVLDGKTSQVATRFMCSKSKIQIPMQILAYRNLLK